MLADTNVLEYITGARDQAQTIVYDRYVAPRRSNNNCFLNATVINTNSRHRSNDNRGAVFALGAVVCIAGSFLLGLFLTTKEDAQDKLKDIRDFKKFTLKPLKNAKLDQEDRATLDTIRSIRNVHRNIFNRRVKNANINLGVTVTAIALGILGMAAAVAGSQAFMLVAVVGLVGVGAFTAFKVGYDYFSRAEKNDAQRLLRLCENLPDRV